MSGVKRQIANFEAVGLWELSFVSAKALLGAEFGLCDCALRDALPGGGPVFGEFGEAFVGEG
ncbi:MAG: hypothetical protein HWE20_07180 [Gammaproteobacteria bacterium]|nr:hypothetical protein [Gammaproteobacteria bacterium]